MFVKMYLLIVSTRVKTLLKTPAYSAPDATHKGIRYGNISQVYFTLPFFYTTGTFYLSH